MSNARQQAEARQLRFALAFLSSNGPSAQELLVLADDPASMPALWWLVAAHQAIAALPAFKEMQAAAQVEKHCLRCHSQYTEKYGSETTCTVPHCFASECSFTGKYEGYDKVYEYEAECCDNVTLEEEGAGDQSWLNLNEIEPCYEGSHTSDPSDMEDESAYNDSSIVRCELGVDGKCTVKERHWDRRRPFFGW